MNKKDILKILVILAVLAFSVRLIDHIAGRQSAEQTQMVSDAVKRSALTCYAVEGEYPSELSYLKEYYGLSYDESRYLVTYDAFASNMLPDIYVMEKGAGMS